MPRYVYTSQEYPNMHFIYGECRGNANSRHPEYRVFIKVHGCYSEGRMPGAGVGGAGPGRIGCVVVEEDVLNEVEQDPTISTRKITRRTGIDKSTVHYILKKNRFYPYHSTRVQTLLPRDFQLRVQFCRQMLEKIDEDPQFFNKILWSDESTLKRDGYTNLHNLHSWQLKNPFVYRRQFEQLL